MTRRGLTSAELLERIRRWEASGLSREQLDELAAILAEERMSIAELAELLERQPASRPLRALAIEVLACWVERARVTARDADL